jgi:hypothetical protein
MVEEGLLLARRLEKVAWNLMSVPVFFSLSNSEV